MSENPFNREKAQVERQLSSETREQDKETVFDRAKDVLKSMGTLFVQDKELDEYLVKRIESLPKQKQEDARKRYDEMQNRSRREKTIAKSLVLSLGLAIGAIGTRSEQDPEITFSSQETVVKTEHDVDTPKHVVDTQKFIESLKDLNALVDVGNVVSETIEQVLVDEGESDEEVASTLGKSKDELLQESDRVARDLKMFSTSLQVSEAMKDDGYTDRVQDQYEDAIAALAKETGESPQWLQQHLALNIMHLRSKTFFAAHPEFSSTDPNTIISSEARADLERLQQSSSDLVNVNQLKTGIAFSEVLKDGTSKRFTSAEEYLEARKQGRL